MKFLTSNTIYGKYMVCIDMNKNIAPRKISNKNFANKINVNYGSGKQYKANPRGN